MTTEETTPTDQELESPDTDKKKQKRKKTTGKAAKKTTSPPEPEQKEEPKDEQKDEQKEPEKDPIEILKEELRKKEEELTEQRGEFLRLKADTDNYRKRLTREKEDYVQYANKRLLEEMIGIEDNLNRAFSATNATVDGLREGVEMISKQFQSLLEKENVQPIQALGEKFDPSLHEVCRQVESGEHEENTIVEEYSKGYLLNGKVLKPSKVVISKLPADDPAEPPDKNAEEPKKHNEKSADG